MANFVDHELNTSLYTLMASRFKLMGKAVIFAAEKHKFQKRKSDNSSYICHPLNVVNWLIEAGIEDIDILCAAVLHDTIEDTSATKEELIENFGEDITGFVLEVTDDKSLPKIQRKKNQIINAPKKSIEATLVKLADKFDNLSSFEKGHPVDWSDEVVMGYKRWCREVVTNLPNYEDTEYSEIIVKLKCQCLSLCNVEFDLEEYYKLL